MRRVFGLLVLLPFAATAHVGNPDIYFDGQAGPYRLFVTIRPPLVIPGVAEIQVRTENGEARSLEAVPVPLSGEPAKYSPIPDPLKRSDQDPQFFTGSLWIMAAGSWQVRITLDGAAGKATMAVPVPSVPQTTKKMQWELGAGLTFLMLLLVLGIVLITGASVREAKLEPAKVPDEALQKRARRMMAVTLVTVVGVLAFGWWWWQASETAYRRNIFSPLHMQADLNARGSLHLSLSDMPVDPQLAARARLHPAFFTRTKDDLILDHDHLMHLYALREPGLDVVYHLHPERTGPGEFDLQLPRMEAGRYRLYADIVHANGFPETTVADLTVPTGLPGRALSGDDARGSATAWQAADTASNSFHLPDGYTMIWKRPSGVLHAKEPEEFRFALMDPRSQTPDDMRLYMGMVGHAAFVDTDGSAFAHIHPSGSVSMASLMMAQEQLGRKSDDQGMAGMDRSQMEHGVPNQVSFPYGFPKAGRYRIIVQMKHGETVETGIFDTEVK